MLILPIPIGVDEYHGGFVLGFFGFVLLLTAIIAGIIYLRQAQRLDQLVLGKGLIVHWKYSPEEWREHVEAEYRRDKHRRWRTFYLIAAIAAILCIAFAIFRPNSLMVMVVVPLALLALLALMTVVITTVDYQRNRNRAGEAFIGKDSICLNRVFHSWKTVGTKLERVVHLTGRGVYIEFRYSGHRNYARDSYAMRVPVPRGQ